MTIEKRTSYNPRACGALCDECPLNGQTVVPPESHANARVALIGEAPGEPEEKHGRPFVGPNGTELDRAIRASGHHRGKFHITYTILCRPPDNDLAQMTRGLSKQAKLSGQVMKTPQECCSPRLNAEIAHIRDLIPLGKTAMQAVTGSSQSILAVRGALVELESTIRTLPRRVLPTVSPGLVQKQQRWAHVFRSDISKAMRAFNGLSGWVEPDIVYHPSAAEFRQFIDTDNLWTYDIETDGIEPLDANIRCIAIGNETKVVVIGLRSNKQPKEVPGLFIDFYDEEELTAIVLRAARILNITIDADGAAQIARRSRGTPRIANRLLRRVRDYAEVNHPTPSGAGNIDAGIAADALVLFGVDARGLDKVDRAILSALCKQFGGGPVGLTTLAISVSEQPETVEDVYEPFLIQQGFLSRTPRGRIAMPAAFEHLHMTPPERIPS